MFNRNFDYLCVHGFRYSPGQLEIGIFSDGNFYLKHVSILHGTFVLIDDAYRTF